MTEKPWTEIAIDNFFQARKAPTRSQCNQLALSLSETSHIHPVDVPGSLSYTVICNKSENLDESQQKSIIVSFRESTSDLNKQIVEAAQEIHRHLVPSITNHGMMEDSDPPLGIYTMPFLPGTACLNILSCEADLTPDEEDKQTRFIQHLARYFARCQSQPQIVEPQTRKEHQAALSRRLAILKTSPRPEVPISVLSDLEAILPRLFTGDYPQVLTHGDLSYTNILVDPESYAITAIVDWSLADVQPFGLELDCLFLMTGSMTLEGWKVYTCRSRLVEAFWSEFWIVARIDVVDRGTIRFLAEEAAKIGLVLRYAFQRNANGGPSEVPCASNAMLKMVGASLTEPRN